MYIPEQLRWLMITLPSVSSNEALGGCVLHRTMECPVFSWRRWLLWRWRLLRCLLVRTEQNRLWRLKRHLHHLNLLSFAFASPPFVSKNLERTPHGPSSQNIFSQFLKAILRMCWRSQKAERAPTCGRHQNLLRFLHGTLPQRTWMRTSCSYAELLHLSHGCFMVPWLSHGNMPERGQGRKEMPFWLKGREKKRMCWVWDLCITPRIHPGLSPGEFFFF